jgi:hypothetical protein
VKISLLLAAWIGVGLSPVSGQVAVLHIQVIEGDGAVHTPGSRSLRPLTVEITSETGQPVEGAAVSFHLPEDGPGGAFGNQLHTDVVITDAKGRASLRGLQLNHAPGPFQIRIVAAKEQAHAGAVSSQYIAEPKSGKVSTPLAAPAATRAATGTPTASRSALKWIAMAVAGGGVAAAVALLAGRSSAAATVAAAAPVSTAVTAAPIIGVPTITVGKP